MLLTIDPSQRGACASNTNTTGIDFVKLGFDFFHSGQAAPEVVRQLIDQLGLPLGNTNGILSLVVPARIASISAFVVS